MTAQPGFPSFFPISIFQWCSRRCVWKMTKKSRRPCVSPGFYVRISSGDTVEYAYMEQENKRRILRFSKSNCRLEVSKIGQDGTLKSTAVSHQFAGNNCPELFAIYRGASSYFMYTQASPFEYTISRLSIGGEVEHQETHSSALSDTPFDYLAVHHIYEQSRPIFIFWDSRGIIKVKELMSEFKLNPLAVNVKQFPPALDPTVPRWQSSMLLPD